MPELEAVRQDQLIPVSGWRTGVMRWAAAARIPIVEDLGSLSLRTEIPATGRTLAVRFRATPEQLVVGMTDEHFLAGEELALAVAAANAWNAERHTPAMSVWDVSGPRPYMVGVCTLPLTVHLTEEELGALMESWIDQARGMYAWCHEVFKL